MANLLRFDFNDRDGIFEVVENGDWVRATDYDALAAKLAEAERVARYESDIAQQALDQMKAEKARAEAAEAKLAEWRAAQHYTYIGKDGKPVLARDLEARADAAEAALASMQSDALAFVLFLDENYRHSFGDIARKKIRAFYARIQTGEKE
jgi:multidrug efflux pump subunit AcrA (membrane-fusion protein)